MNKINIFQLEVFANHGVFPEENTLGQKFIVDITIGFNTQIPGYSDRVEDSIHYGEVAQVVETTLKSQTFKLIESCVEEINQQLYLAFPSIRTLDVKITKPWAPLKQHLDGVSVESTLSKEICYISLGANVGDCNQNFNKAIELIKAFPLTTVKSESSRITTKPYGNTEQPDFLNAVIEIETMLLPQTLLLLLNEVESKLGRVRTEKWGPRTIDLDIILIGTRVINDSNLLVPHPESHLRAFVLTPLLELNPHLFNPLTNKYYRDYLDKL